MAQTKTRTKAKRASGRAKSSGSTSRRGSAKKPANRSKGSGRAKPGSTRSRAPSKAKSRAKNRNSGGSRPKTQARSGASSPGVLEKAKGPATMAGAALIGVAGGIAAVRGGGKRRSGLMSGVGKALPKPNLNGLSTRGLDLKGRLDGITLPKSDGSTIGWVEEKAREIGDAGYRVADLTSEARRLQKGGSGRG
jgi:hypothetical protein